MPPTKDKVLRQLNTCYLLRDKTVTPLSTALTLATAAGASSISVTSNTNYSPGDTVRIGSGNNLETAVTSGAATGTGPYVIALVEPLLKPHAIGDVVVEQAAYDIGDISDAGASVSVTSQGTDVQVATRRLAFTRLNGYADLTVDIALPVVTLEGIAFALGMPLGSVSGDGLASTTPKVLQTDGSEFSGEANASLVLVGVTMDGTPVRFDVWDIDPDYTGFTTNLRRGNLATIPAKFIAGGGGSASQNASSYVANTSYRYGKGKTFDALTEVGLFVAAGSGINTTVAAPSGGSNVKGQAVLKLTTGTPTVGTWLKIDTGSTVEFHRVKIAASGQATFDTPLYRDITTGVTVIEQVLQPFATISVNGVTMAISGNVDKIQEATQRLTIGTKPGNAKVTTSMAFMDFALGSIARAVGIDQTLIANGRFLLGNAIGTAQIDGIYIKGTLQDGTTAWFNMWGCAQDVSNMVAKLANTGIPDLAFSVMPASGIQLMQHP